MMPIEINMLAWSAALCVVLAVPYTIGLILARGLVTVAGNRDNFAPGEGWIGRSQRAHLNLVENLVPFTALVLSVVLTNRTGPSTALAAQLFFFARLGHAVFYIAGIMWLRTLAYALGVVAMVMLLGVLVG